MVLCSRSSTLLEGAFRRAFFYFGQSRLLFILLAVVLHAALLSSLPADSSLRSEPWQALSVHLERHQSVQTVSIASAFASSTTHALVHVKAKQNTAVGKSDLPKVIAETPAAKPRNELSAAPPQVAPTSVGPVVGLALPQLGVAGGHRRLWSVQQDRAMQDEQALLQVQRQREAQLAIQAAQIAEREKFEAQLLRALSRIPLNAPCQLIMPPIKSALVHCEDDSDANVVRIVLTRVGDRPVVPAEVSSLIIDLMPHQPDGAQASTHRSNSVPLPVE